MAKKSLTDAGRVWLRGIGAGHPQAPATLVYVTAPRDRNGNPRRGVACIADEAGRVERFAEIGYGTAVDALDALGHRRPLVGAGEWNSVSVSAAVFRALRAMEDGPAA